jgi:ribose 5-phosphate isomerase B
MKIALGADHAGFPLKGTLLEFLKSEGHEVLDLGTNSTDPVDYPDFAKAVAEAVLSRKAERGLIVCGSGFPPYRSARSRAVSWRHTLFMS